MWFLCKYLGVRSTIICRKKCLKKYKKIVKQFLPGDTQTRQKPYFPFLPKGYDFELTQLNVKPRIMILAMSVKLASRTNFNNNQRLFKIAQFFSSSAVCLWSYSLTCKEHPIKGGRVWVIKTSGKSFWWYLKPSFLKPITSAGQFSNPMWY